MSALNSNEDLSRPPAVVVDDDENGSDSNLHSNDNRRTANATSSNSKITLSSTSPFKLEDDASATAAAAANRTDGKHNNICKQPQRFFVGYVYIFTLTRHSSIDVRSGAQLDAIQIIIFLYACARNISLESYRSICSTR